jgi:site-specific DNA recombinase
MTTQKKRVAGYIRVSSERQAETALSLDAQRQSIVSYSIASDLELVHIGVDAGVSGAKDENERPGLMDVMTLVRDGQVDVVTVCKRDRLARDVSLSGYLVTTIQRAGAEVVILDEMDVSPLTKCVMAMIAEVERILASQRTKIALKALKDRGRHVGAVPYGYELVEGMLRPKLGEVEIVQMIVGLRERGETLMTIADQLTRDGVPTRRGGRWSAEHVRLVLDRVKRYGLPSLAAA